MIIAANLKTNLTRHETASYIEEVNRCALASKQDVLVFPAISSLDSFDTKVEVGTQNAYPTQKGAFTGEIGLEQLDEFGIKIILIGHSERRHVLGESQEFIAQKFRYFKSQGFKIVYCVGEPKAKREAGKAEMMEYIAAQYAGIDTEYENLIIAYEPVWAIGTGLTPTLEDIEDIHAELKKKSSAPLLYGGSVKVNNIKDVLSVKNVDGVLVGSAALYAEHFCTMIQYADEIESNN
ncbi:MAG: triose-phosphate isomerase [Epsilonproteobacteria bacterium]|nr:triose-phosphate isomerase [Campylobacterota bacterium]